ncbi:MAG: N-acetylmuramic acid 6-phosphate etherase [Phycisphaerae bacterium]|nr:N-acetylmuramic acid 6-phosphate etherase [Phycisphaerae bacterium]
MTALPPDRSHIATEARHPHSEELDRLSALECVRLVAVDAAEGLGAVERAAPGIAAFADAVAERLDRGGRLVYGGAGTSGRLGVLDASECPPTFMSDPAQVVGLIAGGDSALRRSSEGKEDEPNGIAPEFERLALDAKDSFLGVAAGGTTPWVLGAIKLARARGALTGLLTCAPGIRAESCDHLIEIHTGPEILTGSTRLKAGTATKVALNAISTAVFVQLGKVYGNLMVDLSARNDKLRDRAIRILRHFDESLDRAAASSAIDAAGGELKVAIVMRRLGLDQAAARSRLSAAHGRLRAVIG